MDLFWENDGWQDRDKHLQALKVAPFQRPFPAIDLTKGPAFYVIRGPRQVGKSSWLKSILSIHPEPKRAFYLSCEGIDDYRDLAELLKSLRAQRDLILLDEVSFVKDWTRAVKKEIDSGYGGVMIVTGSHAGDLRAGADLMPGRFGHGKELILRPMDFNEFCASRTNAGWALTSRHELLLSYFRVGGMPAAVAEGGPEAKTPQTALDTYERWILGDAIRSGKNPAFLNGLMAQIALTMTTPVSLQTLAKKTEIASHHTVQEYIQFLEDCFALRTCYAMNPDTGAYRFRSNKKFYFSDPIIYWIAIRMGGLPLSPDWEHQLAEMVGFEHLAQAVAPAHQRIGYFASGAGEVDYFSPKRWAIELKWSPVAHNLSKAFHTVRVPDKIVWTMSNFLAEWPMIRE